MYISYSDSQCTNVREVTIWNGATDTCVKSSTISEYIKVSCNSSILTRTVYSDSKCTQLSTKYAEWKVGKFN